MIGITAATRIEDIRVEDIFVAGARRPVSEAKVRELADSIKEIGLQTPLTVRQVEVFDDPEEGEICGAAVLVAGMHRLQALKLLDVKVAPCVYIKCSDDEAELWEIDENLRRNEYSEAARSEAMKRRKAIYLRSFPQTANGGDRRSDGEKLPSEKHDRFTLDTAKKTGRSETSVKTDVRRAEALGDDILKVEGTSLDKGVELEALIKKSPAEREALIARAQAGEVVSARFNDPEEQKAVKDQDDAIKSILEQEFAEWIIRQIGLNELPQIIDWLEGIRPKKVIASIRRMTADPSPILDRQYA